MKHLILDFLKKHPRKRFRPQQMASRLKLSSAEKKKLDDALENLLEKDKVVVDPQGRYGYRDKNKIIKGVIKIHKDGFGFVIPENSQQSDVFIPARHLQDAWDGDVVTAESYRSPRDGRYEGRVIQILDRKKNLVMGQLSKKGREYYVNSSDPGQTVEVYIPKKHLKKATSGDLVMVKMIQYPGAGIIAIGEVFQVLDVCESDESLTEAALLKNEIARDFPGKVGKQLSHLPAEVEGEIEENRKDLSNLPFMTIDGVTARDFDDAVCAVRRGRGIILYVSIADVAEYVTKDSALDQEALRRATSVYLPNECIPMLPEKLSNGLCSLNPFKPRLTLTAEIHFNAQFERTHCFFYESLIKSHKRATYEEVQAYFDGSGPGHFTGALKKSLDLMHELSRVLMKKTSERGTLGFDFPEAEILYDAHGKIQTIQKSQRFYSHKLIEEFMITANVAVAQYFSAHMWPLMYRIHERPNDVKISNFIHLAVQLGLQPKGESFRPDAFFESVKGHPLELFLQSCFLRSLKQAVYDPDNRGHYGLQLKDYCHFTSPIRRYPDLTVHRQLKAIMRETSDGVLELKKSDVKRIERGASVEAAGEYGYEELRTLSQHCSQRERSATETEREVLSIKQAFFIKEFIHEKFFGRITRITKFGINLELDPHFVEGWLPLNQLKDDYYVYDEKRIHLKGKRTRRIYHIGDRLWVSVASVKLDKHEILLEIAEEHPVSRPRGGKKRKKRRRR